MRRDVRFTPLKQTLAVRSLSAFSYSPPSAAIVVPATAEEAADESDDQGEKKIRCPMMAGALKPPQQNEWPSDDGYEDEERRGNQPIAFVPFRQQS